MTRLRTPFALALVLAAATVLAAAPGDPVRAPRPAGPVGGGAGAVQVPPVVNPRGISWPASPDHSVTENGVALVTRYVIELSTVAAPGTVAKSVDAGKPALQGADVTFMGMAAVNATLAAGDYTAVVVTEGPGGRVPSVRSDPFTVAPRAAGAAGKPRWIQ